MPVSRAPFFGANKKLFFISGKIIHMFRQTFNRIKRTFQRMGTGPKFMRASVHAGKKTYFSRSTRRFLRQNPGIMREVYEAIVASKKELARGKTIDTPRGVILEKDLNGKDTGLRNKLLIKATYKNMIWFIKIPFSPIPATYYLKQAVWLQAFARKLGRTNGIQIRMLLPRIVNKHFIVSEFFDKERFIQ
jgi:hypothetical protein